MADGDADGDKPTEVRLVEVSGSASCSLLQRKANRLHVRTLQIRKLNQPKTAKENEKSEKRSDESRPNLTTLIRSPLQ